MPLRRRLAIVSAAIVGVAIVLAAVVCYVVVRSQLLGQIDQALSGQAVLVMRDPSFALGGGVPGLPPSAGGRAPYWQATGPDGTSLAHEGGLRLPADSRVRAVAIGQIPSSYETVTVNGIPLRVYTFHLNLGVGDQSVPIAIQLARPLLQVDHVLRDLRLVLLLLCAAGIALAAALGRVAARSVLAPLAEVAQTAEHISETEDLSSRIHVHADDEVGQLAARFNAMVERLEHSRDALDESVHAQRQLVADASHELRTPVTSLRTNVEVLLAGGELDPAMREQLLGDVVEQTEELSALVNDLIELARGDLPLSSTEDIRLDRVVEETLARARRNAPGVRFEAHLAPVAVTGIAERLDRAIGNLLENAARHSPPGGIVEVMLDARGVRVRDHGTGIDDADLPYIFDRFYRGVNSRGRQGSGLGLAIVRQVAEQHGGSVTAENAPGGGALMTLWLPGTPAAATPAGPTSGAPPVSAPDGRR